MASDRPQVVKLEPVATSSEEGKAAQSSATETPPPATTAKQPKLPSCLPVESYDAATSIFQEIQKARGRSLFVLCGQIHGDICDEVYRWRAELKDAGSADKLDVLIHSPGGDLSACYQVAKLLCRRAAAWEALVPCLAASGATLISLGSSNMVISEVAQLGPIDPQVISKRHERFFASERQSPLEAFQAAKYLREFAVASLDATMKLLLERQVAPKPALEAAISLAHHLVQPILSKIEPYDLGALALDSNLAVEYCQRVGNPADQSRRTQRNVRYRALVEKYPVHEFVIDLEELSSLGFNVSEAPAQIDEAFDRLRPQLETLHRYVGFVPEIEVRP